MLKFRESGYLSKVMLILVAELNHLTWNLAFFPPPAPLAHTHFYLEAIGSLSEKFLWSHIIYSLPRLQKFAGKCVLLVIYSLVLPILYFFFPCCILSFSPHSGLLCPIPYEIFGFLVPDSSALTLFFYTSHIFLLYHSYRFSLDIFWTEYIIQNFNGSGLVCNPSGERQCALLNSHW